MEPTRVRLLLDKSDGRLKSFHTSEKTFCFIKSYDKTDKFTGMPVNTVLDKLNYLAKRGFIAPGTVEHEWDEVYRIRVEDTGRIIGFFDCDKFIAIDCFIKKGQKLTSQQRAIIDKVARLKKDNLWLFEIGDLNYEC